MEKKNNKNTIFLTQMAMLAIIEVIFCFTPLGAIPIVPGAIVATTAHLPIIIAALFLGRRAGLFMGGVAGVCAVIYWSTMGIAHPTAFVFIPWAPDGRGNLFSLIISIAPRVIFPYITAVVFENVLRVLKNKRKIAGAIAGFVGTISHSIMILGLIFIAFYNVPEVGNGFLTFIIVWGGFNAICEVILGTIVGALAVSKIGIKKIKS